MQPSRYRDYLDNAALADLYQQHAPALLMHLQINMGSIEDAEDLLLYVFVAALEWESLPMLSRDEQRAWLWRVARNKLVDYYRKHARRQHLPLENVSETIYEDEELAPEWAVLRNEEHRDLRTAIEHLPPQYREVLLLRFVNGLRSPEIARLLGKQDAAVRMLLSYIESIAQVLQETLGIQNDGETRSLFHTGSC